MPKHILVVDDYREGAEVRAKVIQKMSGGDFTTETIFDGKACLARICRPPAIDVILLDIDMDGVSGADVIREILKMKPQPTYKVIPSTAWGNIWMKQWNMLDLKDDLAFKALVMPTYDKGASTVEHLLSMLREAAQ